MINHGDARPDQDSPSSEGRPLLSEPPVAPALGQIIEDITKRLQVGEPVILEEYIRQNPMYARPIRRLFPALQLMSALGTKFSEKRPDDQNSNAG